MKRTQNPYAPPETDTEFIAPSLSSAYRVGAELYCALDFTPPAICPVSGVCTGNEPATDVPILDEYRCRLGIGLLLEFFKLPLIIAVIMVVITAVNRVSAPGPVMLAFTLSIPAYLIFSNLFNKCIRKESTLPFRVSPSVLLRKRRNNYIRWAIISITYSIALISSFQGGDQYLIISIALATAILFYVNQQYNRRLIPRAQRSGDHYILRGIHTNFLDQISPADNLTSP